MEPKYVLRLFLVLACFTLAGAANVTDPGRETETCTVDDPLNLIFIVDIPSFGAATGVYRKALDFIAVVISGLDISETATKIGMIDYGFRPSLLFRLTSNKDLIDQRLREPQSEQMYRFSTLPEIASDLLKEEGRLGAKRVVVALRGADAIWAGSSNTYTRGILNRVNASFIIGRIRREANATYTNLTKPDIFISLYNQSVMTESANRLRNAVCEATHCLFFDVLADVMFAISATRENYTRVGDLARSISDTLDIKDDGSYVGLANTDPFASFQPRPEKKYFHMALKEFPRRNVQSPLRSAVQMIRNRDNGRQNAIKVIVYITDHESLKPQEDFAQAELAKSLGFTVFTATISSGADEDLLTSLASKPEYYLRDGDYSLFKNVIARSEEKGNCSG